MFYFFKISNLLFISGAHYTSSLVSLYKKLGSVANLGWYRQGGEKMVFHLIAMGLHGRMQLLRAIFQRQIAQCWQVREGIMLNMFILELKTCLSISGLTQSNKKALDEPVLFHLADLLFSQNKDLCFPNYQANKLTDNFFQKPRTSCFRDNLMHIRADWRHYRTGPQRPRLQSRPCPQRHVCPGWMAWKTWASF